MFSVMPMLFAVLIIVVPVVPPKLLTATVPSWHDMHSFEEALGCPMVALRLGLLYNVYVAVEFLWFHNGAADTVVSELWVVWQGTQMRPPDQAAVVKSCADPAIVPATPSCVAISSDAPATHLLAFN